MHPLAQRQNLFRMKEQGFTLVAIAQALNVGRTTLYRWLKQGPVQRLANPYSQRPRRHKIPPAVADALKLYFTENNTTTLRKAILWLTEHHGLMVSVSTIFRCCRRFGYTFKKGSKQFAEMDEARAQRWLQDIAVGMGPHVMALDEAAFFFNHVREYAWSKKGRRAVVKRKAIRGTMHSLLLCISSSGVVKYQLYEKAVNAVRFSEFLRELPMDSTVVLDNAQIHRATNVLRRQGLQTVPEVASQRRINLRYLPPYAPQLNPVELCFNTIRGFISRQQPSDAEQLKGMIDAAIAQSLSPAVCDRTVRKVFCL